MFPNFKKFTLMDEENRSIATDSTNAKPMSKPNRIHQIPEEYFKTEIDRLNAIGGNATYMSSTYEKLVARFPATEINNQESDKIIKDFFIWMVRKAKIEVVNAETAIEVHSLQEPTTKLVPVLTLDEFIRYYNNPPKTEQQ